MFVLTASFLFLFHPYLSHSFLVFLSPFLSPNCSSFFLNFSWIPLKLSNLLLSGIRSVMSSCVGYFEDPQYHFLSHWSMYLSFFILSFVMFLKIPTVNLFPFIICNQQQSILPKDRSFTASTGTKAAVLPKVGHPPQTPEPRMQFYQGGIGAVASRCFPHPTLSLASEQILKDLKISQRHHRGGYESGFG